MYGNPAFFGKEVAASLFIAGYSFGMTWLILAIQNRFDPVRVPDSLETAGIDTELEEESAYDMT